MDGALRLAGPRGGGCCAYLHVGPLAAGRGCIDGSCGGGGGCPATLLAACPAASRAQAAVAASRRVTVVPMPNITERDAR
jgi:hypothetical protein